ncbi:MAG: M14 family metallocarboxypeptidase [Clostridia bacterium]|nr:M14 family metallocarboxypeptidase [Clostridia bacterium]
MQKLIRPQPMDYGTVSGLCTALRSRYRFLQAVPLGQSVQGRTIWSLTLGDGEENVLIAATFHAQEWMTAFVCLRLCERLCEAVKQHRLLVDWNVYRALSDRRIMFVPLVNPDGVEIALQGDKVWQANARGVDINHNFNAGWYKLQQLEQKKGICGPSARQWGGPFPESEPETAVMTALCRRVRFRQAIALHSQGEEIYWQYGEKTPSESLLMARAMASVSGYTVASPTGLASHGGFKDWFIEEFGRPGFTIELGRGENPLPLSDFEEIYRKVEEMLLISAFM